MVIFIKTIVSQIRANLYLQIDFPCPIDIFYLHPVFGIEYYLALKSTFCRRYYDRLTIEPNARLEVFIHLLLLNPRSRFHEVVRHRRQLPGAAMVLYVVDPNLAADA